MVAAEGVTSTEILTVGLPFLPNHASSDQLEELLLIKQTELPIWGTAVLYDAILFTTWHCCKGNGA